MGEKQLVLSEERIFRILFAVLILTNSVLSNRYSSIKMMSLIIVFLFAVICIQRKKRIILKYYVFVIVFSFFILASIMIGITNGYEWDASCTPLIRYYLIFPFVELTISHLFLYRQNGMVVFHELLETVTLIILVLCVCEQLYTLHVLPIWPLDSIMNIEGLVVTDAQTSIQMSCETVFSFLLPYFLLSAMNRNTRNNKNMVIVLLFLFYLLMSERKVLIIEAFLTMFLYLGTRICKSLIRGGGRLFLKRKEIPRTLVYALLAIVVLCVILKSDYWSGLLEQLKEHYVTGLHSSNQGVTHRLNYSRELVKHWGDTPFSIFFGHGLNSHVSILASKYYKWNYEVFYLAWLYQTGIMGMLFVAMVVFEVVKRLTMTYKQTTEPRYLYVLVAFLMTLLSSATNPCLSEYWCFVFPFIYLTENKRKETQIE